MGMCGGAEGKWVSGGGCGGEKVGKVIFILLTFGTVRVRIQKMEVSSFIKGVGQGCDYRHQKF